MGLIWENHSRIDCLSCQSSRQRPNKLHQCYTPAHNDHSHRGKEDVGSIHEFLGADAMEALRDHVCCHSYELVSVPFSRITGEPVILSYMWEASSGNKEAIPSSKKKIIPGMFGMFLRGGSFWIFVGAKIHLGTTSGIHLGRCVDTCLS